MKKMLLVLVFALSFVLGASVAFATGLDLTGVVIDTTPVFSMATIVITAIAAIWAIKKVIKLGNRS